MSFREDRALTSPRGLHDTVKPFLPASRVLRWPDPLTDSFAIAFDSIFERPDRKRNMESWM